MKKRTFYIINLDRGRITTLAILLIGFILVSFATGYRFGNNGPQKGAVLSDRPQIDRPGPGEGGGGKTGSSIYALDDGNSSTGEHGTTSDDNLDRSVEKGFNGHSSFSGPAGKRESVSKKPSRELVRREPKPERKPEYKPKQKSEYRLKHNKRSSVRRDSEERTSSRKTVSAPKHSVKKKRSARREKRTFRGQTHRTAKQGNSRADRRKKEVVRPQPSKSKKKSATAPKSDPRAALLRVKRSQNRFANPSFGSEDSGKTAPSGEKSGSKNGGADNQNLYSLQVASFSQKSSADQTVRRLKKQGFHSFIHKAGSTYRVSVGRTANSSSIAALKSRLQEKGYKPITVINH